MTIEKRIKLQNNIYYVVIDVEYKMKNNMMFLVVSVMEYVEGREDR